MKLLLLHCDNFSYESGEATPVAEQNPANTKGSMENAAVVFTCVEKKDSDRKDLIVEEFLNAVKTFTERIGCKNVVLYPYAHLSNSLGSPKFAKELLQDLEQRLAKDFEVHRSPFGYYKAFELKCKGHPLSEAFRDI